MEKCEALISTSCYTYVQAPLTHCFLLSRAAEILLLPASTYYVHCICTRFPGGPEQAWEEAGYDISRISAQLFKGVPERFTMADVVYAAAYTGLSEDELQEIMEEWQRREMVTVRNGLYAKTGHRPYRTDQGYLSEGSGEGSNLDSA